LKIQNTFFVDVNPAHVLSSSRAQRGNLGLHELP
jgi:hypothetical protein